MGSRIGLKDEVRSYLVHQLRDSDSVDRKRFRGIFGAEVTEAIPVALAAWDQEDLVQVDERTITLRPQSRSERTRSLLWLVPEPFLEHEIARRQQLDLSPDGVARLASELAPGTTLSGQFSYGGVEEGEVIIHSPERVRMRFRVAPGLAKDAPLRMVLVSRPPSDPAVRSGLTRAMAQVRGVLRAAEAMRG